MPFDSRLIRCMLSRSTSALTEILNFYGLILNMKAPPKIDSYRFGRIVIDGETHSKDVIILPEGVIPRWWRQEGHVLNVADLEKVFAARPKRLVVGLGTFSRMRIAEDTLRALEEAGIELIALPSKEACQRYNDLREQGDVAAAIHLTC